MVRIESYSNTVGFPVAGCQWVDDKHIILAGGGGASKSGVKNSLKLYKVTLDDKAIELVKEADLIAGEDAPTSFCYNAENNVVACGINGSIDSVNDGTSESLKIFESTDKEFVLKKSKRVLKSKSPFDYQKVTVFDRKGTMLLLAFAEGQVTVLNYPSLEYRFSSKKCENEDINSGDIDGNGLYISTSSDKAVHFWSTEDGELIHTIDQPRGIKNKPCKFRSIQFGTGENQDFIYLAINAADKKRSYISKFSSGDFELLLTRPVAFNPILSFRINNSGTLLAAGCSDLGIRLCCAKTLRTLATVKAAHSFPVTTLSFSPDDNLLVSGSADGTCRVIQVPKEFDSYKSLIVTITTILLLLISIGFYAYSSGLLKFPKNYFSPITNPILDGSLVPSKDEL